MENMGGICRLCGANKDDVVFLFGVESAKHNILLKIEMRLDIMISAADPLPKHACVCCLGKLDEIWMFHEECRRTQASLRKKFVKTLSFPISGTQNIQCEQPETFPIRKSPSMHNPNAEEDFLGGDTINHDLSSPISREGALQDLSGNDINMSNSSYEDSIDSFGGFNELCDGNSNDKLFPDVCDGEGQVEASQDENRVITYRNVKYSGRKPVVVLERKTSQDKCANTEGDDLERSHEIELRCEEYSSQDTMMQTSEMEFSNTHLTSVKVEVVTNSREDSPQGSCSMQEESLTLNAPNLNASIVPGIGNMFDTNVITDASPNIMEMEVKVNGIERNRVQCLHQSPIMDKLPVRFEGFNTSFSSSVERNEFCLVDNILQCSEVYVHKTIPDVIDTFSGKTTFPRSSSSDTESIILATSPAALIEEEDKEEYEKVNILQESDVVCSGNELDQQSISRNTAFINIPGSHAAVIKEEDKEDSENVNILQEADIVTSGNEFDQQSNHSHTSMCPDSNNTEKNDKPVSVRLSSECSGSESQLCVHGIDSKLCYFLICCPGPHSYDQYWQHTEHGLSCSLCEFFSYYLGKMRCHIQTHLRRILFKCSICGIEYSDHRCLRKHILLTHDKKKDAVADKTHTCNNCHETFRSKHVLEHHRKRYCNIRNERCPDCGKYFTKLYRHRLCVPDIFTCDICKKQFKNKTKLTKHINIHMKLYKCDKCDQTFSTRVRLNNHVDHRHGSGGYKCTLCEKSFDAKHQLDSHVLTHRGIRDYLCEICSKSFKYQANLSTHMRFHGKCEFKCALCETKFFQKNMLLSHIKNKHC